MCKEMLNETRSFTSILLKRKMCADFLDSVIQKKENSVPVGVSGFLVMREVKFSRD